MIDVVFFLRFLVVRGVPVVVADDGGLVGPAEAWLVDQQGAEVLGEAGKG